MNRYIDAVTLKVSILRYAEKLISHKRLPITKRVAEEVIDAVCFVIDVQKSADVVPVVHGKWEDGGIEHYSSGDIEDWQSAKCSKCGKWHTTPYMYYFDNYNYCPNCGARMDEVTE